MKNFAWAIYDKKTTEVLELHMSRFSARSWCKVEYSDNKNAVVRKVSLKILPCGKSK